MPASRFELDIMRFNKRLRGECGKVMRKATFSLYAGVVAGTRVDTGRARQNWNVSMLSPDFTTRDAPNAPSARGSSPSTSEMAESGLQGVSMQIKAGSFGDVWISNGLAYVPALERMDQFIDPTIAEVRRNIESGVYND